MHSDIETEKGYMVHGGMFHIILISGFRFWIQLGMGIARAYFPWIRPLVLQSRFGTLKVYSDIAMLRGRPYRKSHYFCPLSKIVTNSLFLKNTALIAFDLFLLEYNFQV